MPIDELIDGNEVVDDEIKKKIQMPFRYLIDEYEIRKELKSTETPNFTVMKVPSEFRIKIDETQVSCLANALKIEDIIEKHKLIRKK